MRRREFIKVCGLLGLSLPLRSYGVDERIIPSRPSESVLIVGAGAAGLACGYLLKQQGIDFQVLEASSTYGGRMKRTTTFADFPIPLGAEWLHVSRDELHKIVNDTSSVITTRLQGYTGQESIGYYEDGVLSYSSLEKAFGDDFLDLKFIGSTWFDLFQDYIVPSIYDHLVLDTQVVSIDHEGDSVIVTDARAERYVADKVIVTVPLKILQEKHISFLPALSARRSKMIQEAPVWGGIKVFLEFTERFYPTYLTFQDSETHAGQRAYFDAAYAQGSTHHVLGLFAVGEQARPYQEQSGDARPDFILEELDEIFGGKASQTYVKHIVQDWDEEPFIRSAYLADVAPSAISSVLSRAVDDKVYFAGDAYTQEDDWGGVHNATQSARDIVDSIVSSLRA